MPARLMTIAGWALLSTVGCKPSGASETPPSGGTIQALKAGSDVCVRREGWLHCGHYFGLPLDAVDAGPVLDHADGYDLLVIDPEGTVWRRDLARRGPIPSERRWRYRRVDFDFPAERLGADEGTVCASHGDMMQCRFWRRGHEDTALLRLPEGAGSIVSIDVDAWEQPDLVVLDDQGAAFVASLAGGEGSVPSVQPVDLPPLRRFDRDRARWAAVTMDGVALHGHDLEGPVTVTGIPPVRDAVAMPNGLCAVTTRGVVCLGNDNGFAVPVAPFGHEHTAALDATDARPELRDDLRMITAYGTKLCVANETDVWCSRPDHEVWGIARQPVVFEDAVLVVSGGDFVCAQHTDGTVECAGPSFGPFAEREGMPAASGADVLYAGQHTLCARFGSVLRCWSRVAGPHESGAWAERGQLDLETETPASLRVGDAAVAWTHDGRIVKASTAAAAAVEQAPWLLRPRAVADGFRREERPLSANVLQQDAEILARSRGYVLMEDGVLRSFGSRPLTLGEAGILTLFTGGLGLLAAPILQVDTTRQHTSLPDTVELAAGSQHLCMRNGAGEVGCFGANDGGQVTGGPQAMRYASDQELYRPPLEQPATMLSAGDQHTCALLEDRSVRCWGWWGPRQVESVHGPSAWEQVPWD